MSRLGSRTERTTDGSDRQSVVALRTERGSDRGERRGLAPGRGQSTVIGVALLLGVTVIALAGLTATIGTVVEDTARTADAERVADGFDRALRPVETTGVRRGTVAFSAGTLRTVQRDLRVLSTDGTRTLSVDGLVYEAGDRRVTFLAGAIAVGEGETARLRRRPPITADGRGGILIVGAPRLNASRTAVGGGDATRVDLRTRVTHDRRALGRGRYRVAVETATPGAWRTAFDRLGAAVLDDRDFDGDGVDSVVARFSGSRTAYLVVHDLNLEVGS